MNNVEQVDELTLEQMAFMMILHSGNARSTIQEAIQLYKTSSYETFEEKIGEAREQLKEAHQTHFSQIQREANGEKTDVSLLLLHAEDHLMSTQTMLDLTAGLVEMVEQKIVNPNQEG